MPDATENPRRSRIENLPATPGRRDRPPLDPFVRSTAITTASLYWLPARFTMPFRQREWVLNFLERLSAHFAGEPQLLPETFLQLKYTREELNKRFSQTLLEYGPVTGVLLPPGASLPATPTSLDIKKLVDNPNSKAEIDLGHLSPDYVAWFLNKQELAQRRDFLGVGGMLMLWVKSDAENAPAIPPMSKALTSHPAFAKADFPAQLKKVHSMQAPWLKLSKEVFGEPIREEALYQGVPFILPLLNAAAFTDAKPEQLETWFSVFHAYCIESEKDKGLLLAVADPDFDPILQGILDKMRDDLRESGGSERDMDYPL